MLALILQLLAGWLLADFLTGLFHWLEDNYGRDDWPVIGPQVIAPNRLHHAQPLAFTRGGFWERNSTTFLAATIVTIPLALAFGPQPWLVAAAVGGMFANQVHYWAHRPSLAPAIVRGLQAFGILQSPRHHQRHHAPPHARRYCILTSWLNPVLDRIDLWAALDRLMPRRWRA